MVDDFALKKRLNEIAKTGGRWDLKELSEQKYSENIVCILCMSLEVIEFWTPQR